MDMVQNSIDQRFEYYSNLLYGIYDFSGIKINDFSQYELDYNDDHYIEDFDKNVSSLSRNNSYYNEKNKNISTTNNNGLKSMEGRPEPKLNNNNNNNNNTINNMNNISFNGVDEPSSSMTLVNKNTSLSSIDMSSSMTSKMKTSKSVTSNYNLLSSSTLLPSNSNFNNKLPTHIILKILCFLYNNPYIGYELNGIRRIPLNPNGDLYNTLFVCKTWYTVAKRILWIKPRFPSIKSYNRFVRILKELTEEKLNKDKAMLSITSPIKASFITNENRKESQHEIKVDDENNSIHNTLEVNNSIKKEKESNELESMYNLIFQKKKKLFFFYYIYK